MISLGRSVGFRIYKTVNRPPRELVEAFRDIPVPNISDNMGRIACVDSYIKPYNEVKLLGTAITVKAPLGDNLMFHKAIGMAKPGDIIVVDGEGDMCHSLCGELLIAEAMKKGIAGFLIDGCIRDIEALRTMNFSVYARGVNPKGPYKNGPGEINVPICCGGQVIFPGDIVVGDLDGVVIIKPEDAEEVLEKAIAHHQMELIKMEKIENNLLDKSWVDKTLKEKGCIIFE